MTNKKQYSYSFNCNDLSSRRGINYSFLHVNKFYTYFYSRPSGIKVLIDESMKVYGEPCISSVDYSSPIVGRKSFFSSVIKPFGINVSYEWTFEEKGTSTEKQPSVIWDNPGIYSFSLKVTDNASKKSVEYHTIEVTGDALISKFPFFEGFEETPVSGWTTINNDGDSYNWITIQDLFKLVKPNYTDADIVDNGFVYEGTNSYSSWSYYPTSFDEKKGFEGIFQMVFIS